MEVTEIKLFTRQQVAKLLGKHPDTIRNWIKAGHLKAKRAGPNGKYMISQADIDEFLSRASEWQTETE